MNKYVLEIDGMRCGMCEIHIEEAIEKNMKVKKAQASRAKKELIVITELDLNEQDFHNVLDQTGYKIMNFRKEEAVKKLFGWK